MTKPGRPVGTTKPNPKSSMLFVRVDPVLHEKIRIKAANEGRKISDYVRWTLFNAVKDVEVAKTSETVSLGSGWE